MTSNRRLLTAMLTCILMGVGVLALVSVPAQAARSQVTLNSVGDRRVGAAIPVIGFLSGTGARHDKTVLLQHKLPNGKWHASGRLRHRADGQFQFPARHIFTPQTARWRAIAKSHGHVLDISGTLAVKVLGQTCASKPSPTTCPQPPDKIQTRDVVDPAVCNPAGGGTVTTEHQTRHQPFVWNPVDLEWQLGDPLDWVTTSTDSRAATAAECPVNPSGTDMLPDLVVRNLTLCSDAERGLDPLHPRPGTNGTCFAVVNTIDDITGLPVTLLKFPGTTFNVGAGAMEVRSTRDNPQAGIASWHATNSVQRIYNNNGGFRDVDITNAISFYWEQLPTTGVDNHGHTHWHILDFDSYTDNGVAAVQEKHGFCLSSTQANGPSLPGAGVLDPNYDAANACGFAQPNVASIIHGMSPLYGDTYPSNLDDQGINITGNVNGVHNLQVCADQNNVLQESDETNNCATATVTVTNGQVVSATGGTGFGH